MANPGTGRAVGWRCVFNRTGARLVGWEATTNRQPQGQNLMPRQLPRVSAPLATPLFRCIDDMVVICIQLGRLIKYPLCCLSSPVP